MTQLVRRDYFTDGDLIVDPYSYFRAMREIGPVYRLEDRDIVLVTGFEECRQVLTDNETFSSINASIGPVTPMPFHADGHEDLGELIEKHRHEVPTSSAVTSLDGKAHQHARSLLNRLFVPSRLKANEEYMAELATRFVDDIVARGQCNLIKDVATPYVTLVVADLLGIPAEDREIFRAALATLPVLFDVKTPDRRDVGPNSYMEMASTFHGYIVDRRANPREDILTQMSLATFPDGTVPAPHELVGIMLILFGAGQDTSAKLLGSAVRYLCEQPEMQDTLRKDRGLIPAFIEEMMRMEGSTKVTSRLAKRNTRIGDVDIPAGQQIAVVVAGANRDPRRFEDPDTFKLNRPKVIEHLGFGRGPHTCIGAPLARKEVGIFLDLFLQKTARISLSDAHHGPKGQRRLDYEPSYGMRGLIDLFVDVDRLEG